MTRQIIYTSPYRSLPVRIFRGIILFIFLGCVLESLIFTSIVIHKMLVYRTQYRTQHHLK